jgi:tocopherol O-methyltransferase
MIVPKHTQAWRDVARHYDDLDQIYRQTWGEHLHHGLWGHSSESVQAAVENLAELVIKRLEVRPSAKVCDVGCGYGATARLIAERFFAEVTGITISEAQFKQVQSKTPMRGKVLARCMNWLDNDLDDESFDHVVSIESSEHMEDKPRFFYESYRVLKAEGTLVVCAWLARESPHRFEIEHLLEPTCRHGKIPSLGSQSEYEEMLRKAGFQLKSFEDLSAQVSKTWSICARRFTLSLLKNPAMFRILFNRENPQIGFYLALFRIRLAYALGSMRYGIFAAVKPASSCPSSPSSNETRGS